MARLALTVPEAARELGVSPWLVRKLIAAGSLPAVRLGERRLVVPVRAVEAWINDQAAS